jgi:hypothetical protein
VLGLLLRDPHAQQPDAPHGVARAELLGELEHLVLRRERSRVHRAGALRAVSLAGVVVEGRHPGDQEAPVAPAGAAGDRP